MGETKLSDYNCSALIQKLNAVEAASNDNRVNSERLSNLPDVRVRIEEIDYDDMLKLCDYQTEFAKMVIGLKMGVTLYIRFFEL